MVYEQGVIREIFNETELMDSAEVITKSFITVANKFGLTMESCPTNPAFITAENLAQLKENGVVMFGLFFNGGQAGFVAVENGTDGSYYLEKLAVLPEYRHNGFGALLIEHVCKYVKDRSGKVVSIGIIDANTVLKDWYTAQDFVETSIRKFDHLPFTVCFMERQL